jgi:hypothetical protein
MLWRQRELRAEIEALSVLLEDETDSGHAG